MAVTNIVIAGLSPTAKRPAVYAAVINPGGKASPAVTAKKVLLVGRLGTGSTLTANTAYKLSNQDDASKAGAQSELADMIRASYQVPGNVERWVVGLPDPTSPAASTLTIAVTATPVSRTTTGAFDLFVAGTYVRGGISLSDTAANIATKIVDAYNADPYRVGTAAAVSATVTVTIDSSGERGDFYTGYSDTSRLPSDVAIALTGGTATASGIVPFTGGAGSDSLTTALSNLFSSRFHRIASGPNAASHLAAWKVQVNLKAAASERRVEHVMCVTNTSTQPTSLATVTCNDGRLFVGYSYGVEEHPSRLAAKIATIRAIAESSDPGTPYVWTTLPGTPPVRDVRDVMSNSTQDALLNSGITPITALPSGQTGIVRGITTYCKTAGGTFDYRVLDISAQAVPDEIADEIETDWQLNIAGNYTKVRDEPSDEELDRVPGNVLYPSLYQSFLLSILRRREASGWIRNVDDHPPVVQFDGTVGHNYLLADLTVETVPPNAMVGINVRGA